MSSQLDGIKADDEIVIETRAPFVWPGAVAHSIKSTLCLLSFQKQPSIYFLQLKKVECPDNVHVCGLKIE
jgi:hypothetical protein